MYANKKIFRSAGSGGSAMQINGLLEAQKGHEARHETDDEKLLLCAVAGGNTRRDL
jgi:hypothetical protein